MNTMKWGTLTDLIILCDAVGVFVCGILAIVKLVLMDKNLPPGYYVIGIIGIFAVLMLMLISGAIYFNLSIFEWKKRRVIPKKEAEAR